ncbi:fibronectin type III domain-containing protein [Nonlabens xiamenensis]|uniref:fibronectin type III domain-containing protein n=1 Tax=Nonlabens xiamenensis TaxID=2341043 RepID=UPI00197D37B1|nr:fibronectin type III domain-containing protein [Nonlabens xiamenensis]
MKQLYVTLLTMVCFSLFSVAQQCDYRLEITDFTGTEWDSGANATANAGVDIIINGTTTTYLVMNDGPVAGQPYTETYTISVSDGDALQIDYRSPSLPGDGQFAIFDSEDIELYRTPLAQSSAMNIYSTTASCPSCPAVVAGSLSVSMITTNSAEIAWTNGGSETQWEIEYGVSPYMVGGVGGTTVPAGTNPFTLNMLPADTTLDVYVRAVCTPGSDVSTSRGPISFTTLPTCPAVVQNSITATMVTADSAEISWTNGGSETQWEIEYGVSPYTVGGAGGTTVPAGTNPFTLNSLSAETTYDVYVRAVCVAGTDISRSQGPYSFTTTESCPPPGAFTPITTTANNIQFAWDANGNPSPNFEVNYGPAPYMLNDANGTTVTGNAATFASITGLQSDTEYCFYVRYDCGMGDLSSWAGPYCARTAISCPVVGALAESNVQANSFDVSWTPGSTETEWEVEYATAGTITAAFTGQGTLVSPNPTTAMTTISGLTDATEYDVYVRAVCDPMLPDYSSPVSISVTTLCLPFTPTSAMPYVEDFESFTPQVGFGEELCWRATAIDLYDWNIDGNGGTPSTGTGPNQANSGSNYFYIEASSGTAGTSTAILTGPQFDLSGLTEPSLQFYYHMFGGEIGDLFIEIDDLSGSGWTTLTTLSGQQQTDQADPFELQIVNLAAYANQTVQLRFRAVSAGIFEGDIAIDDVSVTDLPPCADPNRLGVESVFDTTASLFWSENGTAALWEVEVQPTGVAQGTAGAVVQENNATNPYIATGLMPETTYDFYVRSNCGTDGFSAWVGPFTFTTACAPVVAPYTEDFETFSASTAFAEENCWEAVTVSTWDWNLDAAGGTPTTNTGPSGANSGSNYFYIEGNGGSSGDEASLITPVVDLSNLTAPSMQFASHMFGASTGILHVDVNDGTGYTNDVLVITGEQQPSETSPWDIRVVDLAAYAGNNVTIRFRAERTETTTTGLSDIAIDDVVFDELPACPQPVSLSVDAFTDITADLSWVESGSATAWSIEYGPCGFTPGDGTSTTVPATSTSVTLTGLSAFTCYDYYVTADCGMGTLSAASGPGTFTTACSAFVAPYFTDFEDFTTTTTFVEENCWEATSVSAYDWNIDDNGSTPSGGTGPLGAFSGSKYFYTEASSGSVGDEASLISPMIDISALTAPSVQFKYHMFGGEIGTLHIDVNDGTGYVNDVGTIGPGQQQTAQADDWLDAEFDLQPFNFTGNIIQVRLRAESNGTFEGDISIDDFRVDDIQTCPVITGLSEVMSDATSIDVGWTAGGTESEWLVEYREVGTTTFTTVSPNPTSPMVSITGLNSDTEYEICVSAVCAPTDISFETCFVSKTDPDYCAGDPFVDSGGVAGDYEGDENTTYNICPDNAGDVVYVSFTFNDIEDSTTGCFDGLTIYDGPDTNSPTINTPGGDTIWCWDPANNTGTGNLVGELLIGTSTSGCLTFVFTSDGIIERPGWEANVTCAAPPTCPAPSMLMVDSVTDTTADLSWTAGGTETEWDVEVGLPGFTPDTMTSVVPVIDVLNNPMTTVSGLSPETQYEYYVRSVCAPGDESVYVGPFTFETDCAATVAPYIEDFEAFATTTTFTSDQCWTASSVDAYDWNVDGAGSTPSTGTGPSAAFSGSNYFYIEASSGTANVSMATLESPLVDLSALMTPSVSFYYHMFGGEIGTLELDINDGSGWVNLVTLGPGQIQTAQADDWLEQFSDLTAYAGATVKFRFVATSAGTFEGDISIDDFRVDELPTCPAPSMLSASNVTDTTADLSWTQAGSATTWNVEYGPCGFTPGTMDPNAVTVSGATMNPLTLTGLTPETCYDFYVTADCGGGDTSRVVGPVSFETGCSAFIAPYTEGFEMFTVTTSFTEENCWSTPQTTGYTWDVNSGGTGSVSTGPTGAASGSNYFFTEASSGGVGAEAELLSPLVDISGLTNPALSFSYHMWGVDIDILHVDVNDGTGWVNDVFTLVGEQQAVQSDPWLTADVSLGAFAGSTIQVRFRGTRGGSFNGDIAIDDIIIDSFTGCLNPSNLAVDMIGSNTANFGWTPGGSETSWQVEVQPTGVAQGTATPVYENMSSTNPQTISGLMNFTTYDAYVRADCGMGNLGDWVGPITFTTTCGVFSAPYGAAVAGGGPGNDFSVFPGACWSEGDSSPLANGPNDMDGDWEGFDFANDTSSPNGQAAYISVFDGATPDMDWLVTPEFDLGSSTVYNVYFDIAMTGFANQNSATLGSDDEILFLITTDGGTTWNPLITWDSNSTVSNTGQREVVSLSAYSGVVQFAFYATNGTVADTEIVDFFVDNFSIDVTTGVDSPEVLGFTYYPNPTTDVVQIDAQDVVDTVKVTNLLGQEVFVIKPNSTNVVVDLSTMTSGVYFMQVTTGDQIRTVKVIRE